MTHWTRVALVWPALAWLALSGAVAAQAEPTSEEPTLADRLDALRRGELDPSIDARALFVLPLDARVEAFASATRAPAEATNEPDAEPSAADRDARALVDFLRLPADERNALLDAHAARHATFLERDAAVRAARARRTQELQTRSDQLEAFLDGRLESDVDPTPLLRVDLLAAHDIGVDAQRATTFLDESELGEDAPALLRAQRRFDSLRRRWLRLGDEDKQQLLTTHRERPERDRLAQQMAAERERAAEEARNAVSESSRLVAGERARLLEIRAAQAEYGHELESLSEEEQALREEALSWVRRVRDADGGDADALYWELVRALTRHRAALRTALGTVAEATDVPQPGSIDLPAGVDAGDLELLASELRTEHERLTTETRDARWRNAGALRDAVVEMNAARLALLDQLGASQRANIRGFTRDGWRQVQREAEQIELELRYHALVVPRFVRSTTVSLRAAPAPLVFTALELLLVLLAFRWWRRRAEGVLDELHAKHSEEESLGSSLIASALWYLKQVRSPLEWLALVAIVIYGILEVQDIPEVGYLWTIALWIWIGSLVIRLLDAIAARGNRGSDPTAALRFRSLRLVGITVVVIGLSLTLTEQLVGRGAIFNWVFNGCWSLLLPITLILVHWWRPVVLARARETHAPTRLVAWVARTKGPTSYLAAAIGGLVLMKDGLRRFVLRQAGHIGLTQRVLAYLFRREATKRAGTDEREWSPLSEEKRDALRMLSPSEVGVEEAEHLHELIHARSGALVAVVGERGLGKSTLLDRAARDSDVVRVSCPVGGYGELLAALAEELGLPAGADEPTIVQRLEQQNVQGVVIDDAHRLVRPLIGGLADIDRLLEFAHDLEILTTWVISMDVPGWQYLRRARGDRAFFDAIIRLPRWSAAEIRAWLEDKARAAEIELSFDDLVVPRAIEESRYGITLEDTARDYYRALTDYADGNPAIALHFFLESLGERDGTVYVRLFEAPSASALDVLPQSMLFVLRSVVQLGLAIELDVVRCTDLHPADVSDALRAARTRGLIELDGQRYRVSQHWYRAVTAVLQRHHLLMRAA